MEEELRVLLWTNNMQKGSKIPLVFTIAKPPHLRTEVFVHSHFNSDVDSILHSDGNNRVKFDFEHDIVKWE